MGNALVVGVVKKISQRIEKIIEKETWYNFLIHWSKARLNGSVTGWTICFFENRILF
jgi:hypothetical protein